MKLTLPATALLALLIPTGAFADARTSDTGNSGAVASATPKATKPVFLGVELQPVDGPTRKLYKMDAEGGMLVVAIFPGSPADGHLAQGDILLKAGDRTIGMKGNLRVALLAHQPGDDLTFSLLRGGQPKEVIVKLVAAPQSLSRSTGPAGTDGEALMRKLLENTHRQLGDNRDFFSIAEGDITITGTAPVDGVRYSWMRRITKPEGVVVVRKENNGRTVRVTDASGKVLADGVLTQESYDALPEWARESLREEGVTGAANPPAADAKDQK